MGRQTDLNIYINLQGHSEHVCSTSAFCFAVRAVWDLASATCLIDTQ